MARNASVRKKQNSCRRGFLVLHPADVLEVFGLLLPAHAVVLTLILDFRETWFRCFLLSVILLVDGIIAYSVTCFITIDSLGVHRHSIFSKTVHIAWEKVLCSGYFSQITNPIKQRKFIYFSTKPLDGKIDDINRPGKIRQTDTLIFVAKQRDIEKTIVQHYPKFRTEDEAD